MVKYSFTLIYNNYFTHIFIIDAEMFIFQHIKIDIKKKIVK